MLGGEEGYRVFFAAGVVQSNRPFGLARKVFLVFHGDSP